MMLKKMLRRIGGFYLDLKIIWKLIIGFGFTLLTVLLITAINQWSIFQINHNLEQVIEEELEPMTYLTDIRSQISELEVTTRDALINRDELSLKYIRNQFLPNTVRQSVEYSFDQLIKGVSREKDERVIKMTGFLPSRADQRMNQETVAVLQELRKYWTDYYAMYRRLLGDTQSFQSETFFKETSKYRYFLMGGIDRLIETNYRQRAVVAKTEADQIFARQQNLNGLLLILAIILTAGASYVTAWSIIIPLRELSNATRKLGDGNLAVHLSEERRDELGDLARCFNMMSGDLRALIGEIDSAVQKVSENSQKLIAGTSDATSTAQQLLTTMTQVAAGAEVQQNKVTGVHQVFKSITEFSENVNQATHRVAGHSQNSVTHALQGEETARAVYAKIIQIKEFMSASERTMKDLQALSKEIQGMVGMVKEIADQTNLLSLNASIEAARAGEAGRGFSIVAASIGDLAVQTKNATNQVTGLVKRIQQNFETLSAMIATENQEMAEGEKAVAGLEEVFETIIGSARKVNSELHDVTAYTQKLSREHEEALSSIRQIAQIADEHKEGTLRVSNSVEQQFGFTQEIIGISQILAHWGDTLHASVGKFKKEVQPGRVLGMK